MCWHRIGQAILQEIKAVEGLEGEMSCFFVQGVQMTFFRGSVQMTRYFCSRHGDELGWALR